MISIIVPNLNERNFLPYFLESLAHQKYKNFELIIVDGGSTDGSRKVIDRYREKFDLLGLINETRNIGFVRNLGAKCARGELLFFTNSDAYLPSQLLLEISLCFKLDPTLQALSGRTIPFNGGSMCYAAYFCFDLLRAFMAKHFRKFCPSGNFLAIRASLFHLLGGFPEVKINEDGQLGEKISAYCRVHGGRAAFYFSLTTGHFAKRWKRSLSTLLFYFYVFGNFNEHLKYLLKDIEAKSGEAFAHR